MTAPVKYSTASRPTIDGVQVKPLRRVSDERGWLMEILRADETELFTQFGQVYVSATYPGVVKGWHYHRKQVDNFACVAGMIKLVLIDTRAGSPTEGVVNEFFMGALNPVLVKVPNLVYHGWKCIGVEPSLVVNVSDEPYHRDDPDEHRVEPHGVLPYDWSRIDG